jgi:hypothetical protein
MVKLKKIIHNQNIPEQGYTVIDQKEVLVPKICANCNREITDVVVVQGSRDGKRYNLGLGCAERILNK